MRNMTTKEIDLAALLTNELMEMHGIGEFQAIARAVNAMPILSDDMFEFDMGDSFEIADKATRLRVKK